MGLIRPTRWGSATPACKRPRRLLKGAGSTHLANLTTTHKGRSLSLNVETGARHQYQYAPAYSFGKTDVGV
ncbi:unnamed protein product [Arctia plantaginis]|uniref:Uncharacterized protein n=1 Tax=Arctia plantaginis TaxID=874455 RepID=A0A8S1B6V2_ARCPL|nr:unnamed protein product [Arctia plantaginis]